MKNTLLLALAVGFVALAAQPAAAQTAPSATMSKAEMKRAKKARKQTGPEVYKGTVAEQRRIVTDAAGSQRDEEADDNAKAEKKMKKGKN